MKKSTKKNLKIISIIAAILIFVAIASFLLWGYVSAFLGSFGITNNFFNYNSGVPSPYPGTQYLPYNVQITITPNPVCAGDTITGTINSNIPFGICGIFVNSGTGWNTLMGANLDASGHFSTTTSINNVMSVQARAVCCDGQGNCRISNEIHFVSQMCANPPQGGGNQGNEAGGTVCTAIWNPSATTCSQGSCSTGICTFVPATLATVARCECQIPDPCEQECISAGYPHGGYYSGGVTCDDFEHYLSGPQCCCRTDLSIQQ